MAVHPPVPARSEAWRARRARYQALVDTEDWLLVKRGLRALQMRAMETVAGGTALPEQEIRELQARYRLLEELLTRPVETLTQFDDKGDER